MPATGGMFVLKHVFENVTDMKEGVYNSSKTEKHFGVPWKIIVRRNSGHLGFFICCEQSRLDEWSIDTWYEMKILTESGKVHCQLINHTFRNSDGKGEGWGSDYFIEWDQLMKEFVVDDSITAKIQLKIRKMSVMEKLRNFDESMKKFSDVVLVVGDEKFYVSKLYLAMHSTYFEALFARHFEESNQPEILLTETDAKDFQNFLELLHGDPSLRETTIEEILHLADKYEANSAIQKCEQFLIENSRESLKQKLDMAHRYNLEKVKDHCLFKITSASDIQSVLASDFSEMDPAVVFALLQKSLSFKQKL